MTPDQRFTLILLGLGLLFSMLSAAIGLLWRMGNRAGQSQSDMKNIAEDVKNVATSLDQHIQWHMRNSRR